MDTKTVLEASPQTVTRTYVVFTVRSNDLAYEDTGSRRLVEKRDPQRDTKLTNHPCNDVVAFRYYDVEVTSSLVGGETKEFEGDPRNFSRLYIVDGKLMDADAVAALGNRDDLVVDMARQGWDNVVRYYYGGFMPGAYDPNRHELVSTR